MKKLFIFDLDGVLTSTSNEHFLAWTILGEKLNFKLDKSIEEKTKGVSRLNSLNIILSSVNLENKYSETEKLELANTKNEIYKKLISNYSKDNLYGGVIQLFDYLKSKNMLIALASASLNGPTLIKSLEIDKYFDYVVDPKFLKSKPASDIFEAAQKHFSLKNYECVGIEDSKAGIDSINSAGMLSIGIGTKENLKEADVLYSSIDKIDYQWLDKLIDGDKL